ncbi:MAG: tRNA (adenosine(37)-N6)-threonylcarbamoyltransferase complex ATPase subunit type 1 TsaE [Candidatus Marinimicrobia bacterium]|nr:tRNA (adenosine(37)-N6)-threonylcarbamoyltransferase complex ATPase subunit type 1 TsaE [Candidatus Neomarinimicrobiota bacterium]
MLIIQCQSVEETQNLAKKLAKKISQGSIISLIGDLGTGKTTFTKGFAKQLGIEDHVTSPTFKLVSEYQGEKYKLYHIDAYRMDGPNDFLNIGGEEYLSSKKNITIIEWGDLLMDLLPERTITVNFTRIKSPKESRRIQIRGIEIV